METLEIRKKGNKNFWHYYNNMEYASSDLNIETDGDNVLITKKNGAYVLLKEGFNYSVVFVYDDTATGAEETFLSVEALFNRLIALGYPAFTEDGETDITGIDGNT